MAEARARELERFGHELIQRGLELGRHEKYENGKLAVQQAEAIRKGARKQS